MKKLPMILALIGALFLISTASAQCSQIRYWGSFGNENGQFYTMTGIAADTSGNVYVAELDNRVQKFSENGEYLTQFNIPARDIAIDLDGNIYATVNNSIQKFNSTGTLLNTWVSTGTENGTFKFPTGIALDSSGNIYVSDMNNNSIQKLDSLGNYVTSWGTFGSGNGNFKSPAGIDVSGDYVYVADMGNYRIQKFDLDGNYVLSLGSKGTGDTQFNSSIAVATDSSGNIYVADHYNGRVIEYDSNFTYLTQYTGHSYPTALVTANRSLYVLDSGTHQVWKYYKGISANFTSNVTQGPAPLTIQFTNLSENATSLSWDFENDGISDSNEINPVHVFTTPEVYTVNLTVSNGECTASKLAIITVSEEPEPILPVANFSASPTEGYAPLTVQFTDLSENATSVNWDFGDGANSTQQNPIHTYSTAGNYTVNLTATNANGTNSISTTINVMKSTPTSIPGLVVSYDGNITSGKLIDLSGNSNTGYVIGATQGTLLTTGANYVSFDGVNNRVNILANGSTNITKNLSVEFIGNISTFNRYGILVHKYQSGVSGWYISTSQNAPYNTIRFGLVGTDTILHSYVSNIQLNASQYYDIVVTYNGTIAHIYVNSVDSANPANLGVPIAGSSVNTSLYYSPSIFNNTKGNLLLFRMYNRTLTQAEVTQNYEDNKWRYIPITIQPVLPVANFSSNVTSGYPPLSVQFTDLSKNATGWNWDFGDGVNSTQQNPIHTYSTAGNYTVSLTATNVNGTNSTSATINVMKLELPVANFNVNSTRGYVPLSVQFNDLSKNATDVTWEFGDGANSTQKNPMHTYSTAGNYTVNLTATNVNGTNSTSATITVLKLGLPIANFSTNITSGYAPLSVQFNDLSQNATNVSWDFGDGNNSTQQNPIHTYYTAGNYTVNLTATNANGTNSISTTINVIIPPPTSIPGLVVSYDGNITSGKLIDLSGNSNTGYVIGATQGTLLTTGANYVSFDGVNNRVNILANASTNITKNLSVEFIGNISTFNRYGILVHKYQSGVSGWYISISQNAPYNTIRFGLVGTDTILHSYVSNIQLNASQYYDIVVTYNGTIAHIYVNSVDSANPANLGVPIIGSSVNTSLYYSPSIFNNTKGNLLLFRMYNRTLTQAEVTQNYEDNKWRYIPTTMQPVLPVANFSSNVASGYPPLSVQFNDLSKNATGWNWNFGDGVNSTQQNPIHTYYTAGIYTVSLTATNANGTNSTSTTINVTEKPILPVANFSTNVSEGYASLTVQFTNMSENATSVSWDFENDGTPDSIESDPVHEFTDPGTYTVNLTAINGNGTASKLATINVTEKPILPVANFSTNVSEGYAPLSVQFTNLSENATSVSWDFNNDGTPDSIESDPVHEFTDPGTYTVNLTAINGNGTASKLATINVTEKPILPVANFTANNTEGNAPLTVQFTNMSENATSVSWDFENDGTPDSIESDPVHEFTDPGTYTVNLTAINGNGTASKLATINVTEKPILPVANFSTNVSEGYAPLSVQFTNLSENATSVSWDFNNDGTPDSIESDPVHEFTDPGTYTVNLTVANENGTASKLATINVTEKPILPVANFTANNTEGNAPLTVQFTNMSENATSVSWDFENDGTPDSIESDPVHVFTVLGTYTVNLTAANENGTASKLATINVTEKPILPVANFTANNTEGNAPLTVQFTNMSENATSVSWDFENDGTPDSIESDPVHEFTDPGTYTVNLTAINGNGTASKLATINVTEKPILPVANFSTNVSEGYAPLSVQFTNLSENATSVSWDFNNDGTPDSIESDPVHEFTDPGTYTVNLTVANENGTASKLATINVTEKPILPVANFTANNTEGNAPLTVQFTNLSENATSVSWDFENDGTPDSIESDPVHVFTVLGTYTVNLTAANENGTASKLATINVTEKPILPVANFTANNTEGNAPLTVQFTNLSENATSVSWDFENDGTPDSIESDPVHEFTDPGTYTVNLTAINGNGTASKLATINVTEKPILPVANFSTNVSEGYAPLSVQFTNLSENATSVSWDFNNDGTPDSIESDPVHVFTVLGTYTVNLTAANENGTASKLATINVTEKPILPVANFTANNTEGNAPLTVQFTNMSENATSVSWDFENDGTPDSIESDPVHEFTDPGTYTVNLTAINGNGTASKLATINVTEKPILPVANFSTNVSEGYAPLSVQFTNLSENATSVSWDFNNDGTPDSIESDPVHVFTVLGTYTVNLTVANENGTASKLATINVTEKPILPVANFSTNVSEGYAPLSVQFNNLSQNATGWNWDFGDGNNSTQQNPIHTYYTEGNYTVNLTATNANGTNSISTTINVTNSTFHSSWGSFGDGDGQFYGMSGIAKDIAGNLYIAELDNRVQKFDKYGSYITQFNISARNIAIDSSGNIYATVNDTVVKYNSDGGVIFTCGSTGTGNGQFNFPIGIALDKSGYVYVVDSKNHRVQKFDSDGNYVTKWGTFGVGNGAFKAPTGIAIDNDSIYVSDTGNYRIQKFDLSGNYISKFGEPGTGLSQFNSSVSIYVDASHNLYVSDYYNGRVIEYDKNFSYVTQYTGFSYPMGVVATSSSIYVIDSGNYRVISLEQPENGTNSTSDIISIMKSTPIITWNNPADITSGTALSSNQLNAKASVPGSFIYSPASGTIPRAGTHILQTTFTPTDSANYTTTSSSVSLIVNKATPVITWNNPADITSGTALSSTQLNAKASVPGTLVYTPAAGTVLNAGTHTLHVDFTPTDAANYINATADVTINVLETTKVTPAITWNNPVAINYGTTLSETQLNANASVPGSFVYNPVSGTILGAGTQTLQTTFTPTDTTNYITASSSVSLTVNKATPVITWSNPADISSSTPLGETQLNANASVPGSFAYAPAAGTVFSAETHTLQSTFTPTDTANYTTASSSVLINVVNNAPAKSSSGNKKYSPVELKILEPNSTQSSNSIEDIGKEIKSKSRNKTINEDTGEEINLELRNKTISQHNKSNKGLETEQQKIQSISGFGIIYGVTCLLGVLLYKRK